jgi:hypothetical protein
MTRAVTIAELGDQSTFNIDGNNQRIGIASASPTATLDVGGDANISGVLTATSFVGDGANLTGVSGFATALSTDQTSVLNRFFKTPEEISVGAGTSISVTSDDASGNLAFCREGKIHVAVGGTFHIGSGTTLATNVLGVF